MRRHRGRQTGGFPCFLFAGDPVENASIGSPLLFEHILKDKYTRYSVSIAFPNISWHRFGHYLNISLKKQRVSVYLKKNRKHNNLQTNSRSSPNYDLSNHNIPLTGLTVPLNDFFLFKIQHVYNNFRQKISSFLLSVKFLSILTS